MVNATESKYSSVQKVYFIVQTSYLERVHPDQRRLAQRSRLLPLFPFHLSSLTVTINLMNEDFVKFSRK